MEYAHVRSGNVGIMHDLPEIGSVLADRVEVLCMSGRGLGRRLEEDPGPVWRPRRIARVEAVRNGHLDGCPTADRGDLDVVPTGRLVDPIEGERRAVRCDAGMVIVQPTSPVRRTRERELLPVGAVDPDRPDTSLQVRLHARRHQHEERLSVGRPRHLVEERARLRAQGIHRPLMRSIGVGEHEDIAVVTATCSIECDLFPVGRDRRRPDAEPAVRDLHRVLASRPRCPECRERPAPIVEVQEQQEPRQMKMAPSLRNRRRVSGGSGKQNRRRE